MRGMTALYHRRFFSDVWLTMVTYLAVLTAGHLGAEPMVVDICLGCDDDAQVWIDSTMVMNIIDACSPEGYCQFTAAALIAIVLSVWALAIYRRPPPPRPKCYRTTGRVVDSGVDID